MEIFFLCLIFFMIKHSTLSFEIRCIFYFVSLMKDNIYIDTKRVELNINYSTKVDNINCLLNNKSQIVRCF